MIFFSYDIDLDQTTRGIYMRIWSPMLQRLLFSGVIGVILCCAYSFAVASGQGNVVKIVTTVSPITNMVQNVGGKNVVVKGIVPEGMDSHTFEPIPSDVKTLQEEIGRAHV